MFEERAPPMVIGGAPTRIGPQRLELDLALELGNGPAAAQNGGPPTQQARPLKNTFLLGVYHRSHQR